MKLGLLPVLPLLGCLSAWGWFDYGVNVKRESAEFGKPFAGISLKLETRHSQAELNSPEPLTVTLKNENPRSALLPESLPRDERVYALYVVCATAGGLSYFTPNLVKDSDNPVTGDRLAPNGETVVVDTTLDRLPVVRVESVDFAAADFPGLNSMPTRELVPQVYVLKAILLSRLPGKKPDFVAASNSCAVLLLPERGEHMSPEERQTRAAKYLAKLEEGAYGGIAVSSQLAALGETAVPQLIATADRKGEGHVRESRVWAIATLCRTGSPKAAEYVLERLKHPVDLGDVAFLAWHSQGCSSPAIEAQVLALVSSILKSERLPWQDAFPEVDTGTKSAFLEFAFKHFNQTGQTLPVELVGNCITWPDQKPAAFGIELWKPGDAETAVRLLAPVFGQPNRHPNLKRVVLLKLETACAAQGFPKMGPADDLEAAWQRAGRWLTEKGYLSE